MIDVTTPKQVIVYANENAKEPFTEWLYSLRDVMARKRILARVSRLEQGNYGDCEPVGEGVSELRLFFGSGYRVYFGEHGNEIVVFVMWWRQKQPNQRYSTSKSLLEGVFKS